MDLKTGFLLIVFFVGGFALPSPEDDVDMSMFFDHSIEDASRILGGSEAPISRHRHMVALTTGASVRSLFCGGSLVSRRSILTAAHCIGHVFRFGSLTNSVRATVGTNRWASGGTSYTVARNISHPHYVSQTATNDIGLFITSSNVVVGGNVQIIPINYNFIGRMRARVAGWGLTRMNGAVSPVLMEIQVNTLEGNDCVTRAARASIDLGIPVRRVQPHIELCTLQSAGVGTCHGDSGSALTRVDNGQQIGIVSWGFPCARGAPDMFARISAYQDWLRRSIVN